jgi:NADH:ubiquinone oxidoreductase subunit E
MSKGLDEIKESFSSGNTLIEQVCENSVCFLKGYKEVYDELKE